MYFSYPKPGMWFWMNFWSGSKSGLGSINLEWNLSLYYLHQKQLKLLSIVKSKWFASIFIRICFRSESALLIVVWGLIWIYIFMILMIIMCSYSTGLCLTACFCCLLKYLVTVAPCWQWSSIPAVPSRILLFTLNSAFEREMAVFGHHVILDRQTYFSGCGACGNSHFTNLVYTEQKRCPPLPVQWENSNKY